MENIIPSAARTTAVGKYLVALSLSFAEPADGDDQKPARGTAPSGWRRQLHVLYLLNDVLHHTKFHFKSPSAHSTLTGTLQSSLVDLFRAASAYNLEVYVQQHRCIADLLDIWEGKGYYQPLYIQKLKDTVSNSSKVDLENPGEDKKPSEEVWGKERKDPPYILPPSHGDSMTPFHDLPAANMMPHIVPNSAIPIKPQSMKALQFTAGPADEDLVVAVRGFLTTVDSLDAHDFENKKGYMDVDDLGQPVPGDEITGNSLGGNGYYGWSRAFCEKMKQRGLGLGHISKIVGRAVSTERSLSPHKRRRYSDSGSSRSRDRNFGQSRSSSISSHQGARRRNLTRSSSKSRESSGESRRYRSLRSLRSRSQSRSLSYSPPQAASVLQRPLPPASPQVMQHNQAQGLSPPTSMPFPQPFSKGFLAGPGGIPIPPPPPNYHGPWPPPPPPMPNSRSGDAVPAPTLPIGPRIGHDPNASAYQRGHQSGFQSQLPQGPGSWNQQQFGHVSGYPYGDRGGVQQPFNGSGQNGRRRGYGRGGWSR